jgi:hypothetical protein
MSGSSHCACTSRLSASLRARAGFLPLCVHERAFCHCACTSGLSAIARARARFLPRSRRSPTLQEGLQCEQVYGCMIVCACKRHIIVYGCRCMCARNVGMWCGGYRWSGSFSGVGSCAQWCDGTHLMESLRQLSAFIELLLCRSQCLLHNGMNCEWSFTMANCVSARSDLSFAGVLASLCATHSVILCSSIGRMCACVCMCVSVRDRRCSDGVPQPQPAVACGNAARLLGQGAHTMSFATWRLVMDASARLLSKRSATTQFSASPNS